MTKAQAKQGKQIKAVSMIDLNGVLHILSDKGRIYRWTSLFDCWEPISMLAGVHNEEIG